MSAIPVDLVDDEEPDPFYAALMRGAPLGDLIERPAWQRRAACRGMGPEMFFPPGGDDAGPAREVCGACPVANECEALATATSSEGVWAGRSGHDATPSALPEPVLRAVEAHRAAVARGEMFPVAAAATELKVPRTTIRSRLARARSAAKPTETG